MDRKQEESGKQDEDFSGQVLRIPPLKENTDSTDHCEVWKTDSRGGKKEDMEQV